MPLCKPGLEWSWSENKCVPVGTRFSGYVDVRREKGLITPMADILEKQGFDYRPQEEPPAWTPTKTPEQICAEKGMKWNPVDLECVPDSNAQGGPEKPGDCAAKGMVWSEAEKRCVTPAGGIPTYEGITPEGIMNTNVVGETPTALNPDIAGLQTQLAGLLSTKGQQEAEDAYWATKMKRLEEEYVKKKDQLNEDLNVKGLYFSGVRADKLQELSDDYQQVVAEEEAKFQYERFQRDLQRNQQAIGYVLGAKAQDIQWSLGRGQLTLGQLDTALQASLGINTLQLKEMGMLNDFVSQLAYTGIAQAQTDIQRQQAWATMVQLMYQMGLSENDINAIWLQIAGQQNNPPV